MRGWNWLGGAGLFIALAWALSIDNPKAPKRVTEQSDVQPIQREVQPQTTARTTAAVAPNAVTAPAPTKLAAPAKPFQYQAELDSFSKIRTKVFLNEQEKAERQRLLNDASLLRALGLHLTEASIASTSKDAAVELLIEALKTGDKAMASEVAKAVIEDAQVENASLERGVRESLAGIKAEVLYHWAAYMPEDAAGIERYLPGPVSQKIWANVARRHASNAAESQQELAKRK